MAIGFLLKKIKLISARGQKEITDLVINLILPANIITSFMTEISTDTISDCAWIAVISIGIQLIALFYGNLFFHKENENRLKCLKYAIICSNAGFLGNPVAEGVFGPVGLMLASVYLIPQRIMMWSEGIAIFSGVSDKKATLKKVVTHPCVTKHMMNTPELLIAEFNLDDWKNPNYMGGDLSRICLPKLKDKYTGIVRV